MSEDFNETLIEAVRKNASLWDKRSKHYMKKKSAKELDWRNVAEECQADVSIVKEKWRHLRDYYQARRRKKPPSGSSARDAPRLGRYGQLLSFLDPVTQRGAYVS
ncbi:uncharacterized protein LOC122376447 [Amphibalanus amphitrite]|uniref:uncharacterized protein LOC122376447 n=1 Tax=Amphibalanus amphitrite TaxID=1232801 RepID=UPI001C918B1D|nr:uncharacterized protein LOC122376447 [Amphibalanus amphitrite]